MNRRSVTFGDLLARLAPALPAGAIAMSPIVASAVELNSDGTFSDHQMWVVVHTVTDTELRLIHPELFRLPMIAIQFNSRAGEVLRVVLEAGNCSQQGQLFETCARFATREHGTFSASA